MGTEKIQQISKTANSSIKSLARQNMFSIKDLAFDFKKSVVGHLILRRKKQPSNHKAHLWIGPPGIGKTEIARQLGREIAEYMGLEFVDGERLTDKAFLEEVLNTRDKYFIFLDTDISKRRPEDFGIPNLQNPIKGGEDAYITSIPAEFAVLEKHPGMIFFDEITNIKDESLITAIYKVVQEKKIGSKRLHENCFILLAGNSEKDNPLIDDKLMNPVFLDRCFVRGALPPSPEEWFEHISEKYPDFPKSIINFLSNYVPYIGQIEIANLLENVEIKDKHITTPRGLESLITRTIQEYDALPELTGQKYMDYLDMLSDMVRQEYPFLLAFKGCIMDEHLTEFEVFISEISNLKTLIEQNQMNKRTLQIAGLTSFGEMIRTYALSGRTEKGEYAKQYGYYSYDDVQKYTVKLLKMVPSELYNFLFLGAGISNKKIGITDMLYTTAFMIGMLSGKNYQECVHFSKNYDFTLLDYVTTYRHEEKFFDKKIQGLRQEIEKIKDDDLKKILNDILDLYINYNKVVLTKLQDLLANYMAYQTQNLHIEKELKKLLGPHINLNELIKIVHESDAENKKTEISSPFDGLSKTTKNENTKQTKTK